MQESLHRYRKISRSKKLHQHSINDALDLMQCYFVDVIISENSRVCRTSFSCFGGVYCRIGVTSFFQVVGDLLKSYNSLSPEQSFSAICTIGFLIYGIQPLCTGLLLFGSKGWVWHPGEEEQRVTFAGHKPCHQPPNPKHGVTPMFLTKSSSYKKR